MTRQRERAQASAVTAAELMTKPPVTIGPDESVANAARLMYSRRLKRLPVTTDDGTLIGIVSRADVLSVYGREMPDTHQIVQDLILGRFRCEPARFTVTVTDGIVTIEGAAEDHLVGRDIVEAARHVEGRRRRARPAQLLAEHPRPRNIRLMAPGGRPVTH